MPFVIEVITVPDDRVDRGDIPSELMKEINHQYVGSIITSIIQRRFRKRTDIIKQIILTRKEDEAELFDTLSAAQIYWKELYQINNHYLFRILEIK